MLKNIQLGDEIDNLIILDKFGGENTKIENKTQFGVVYIALDINDEQIYAMKTFQDKFIDNEEDFKEIYENFQSESLECVKLKYHPNVVFSLGVRIIEKRPFLVMEPILPNEDGRQTLKDYLKEKITIEQALDWAIQICYGMEFINCEGIKSHGDLKPENILIDFINCAKISDFGFLELIGEKQDNTKGTPIYMAPESFDNIRNVKSDIYSFGIILYQLFNKGQLPFYSENNFLEEWETLHKTCEIPQTSSEHVNQIIKKCLKKDPDNRYSSFKEIRDDLEKIFLKISKKKLYTPEMIELSEELHNLSIAHSYGQYGNIELFKKYSKILCNSENNDILLEHGIDLIFMKDYKKAIKLFEKIINNTDEDFEKMDRLYFNLGHAYHESNRLYDAEYYYLKCLNENENYYKARVNLGNVYRSIGDYDISLKLYDEVLDKNPNLYEALYHKAILLGHMKRFEEAECLFDKIKYLKANNDVFYDKALMYYDTNPMISLLELSNIDIIDKNDAEALFFMIMIHINNRKPELAKEKYKELIQISDRLKYKLDIASEFYKKGYKKEFMEIYDRLKESDDLNEKYKSIFLYSKLIRNENISKSIELMDKILKSNAANKIKSKAYVYKFIFSNGTKQSKKYLDNALKLDNKNRIAYLNYTIYYAHKKQWDKALKKVNLGLKKFPTHQEMLFLKGRFKLEKNEINDAVTYFKKALESDLPSIKIYVHLFFCNLVSKNPEDTDKYFNYAINLDGNYNSDYDYDELLNQLVEKYIIGKDQKFMNKWDKIFD